MILIKAEMILIIQWPELCSPSVFCSLFQCRRCSSSTVLCPSGSDPDRMDLVLILVIKIKPELCRSKIFSNLGMIKDKAGFVKTKTLLCPGSHLVNTMFIITIIIIIIIKSQDNCDWYEPLVHEEMEMLKVFERCPLVDLTLTRTLRTLRILILFMFMMITMMRM